MRRASPLGVVRLFLAGDVMLGRGVDQILPFPGNPVLHERYMTSALDYVALAERHSGPIPRQAGFAYVWGALLDELITRRPHLRLANLETAATTSGDAAAKGINYRMNPRNVPTLGAAGIDVCLLANNHVLDWGASGLVETLDTLDAAGIGHAGAGRDAAAAARPRSMTVAGGARLLALSFGCTSSGIPDSWCAQSVSPGVALVAEDSDAIVAAVRDSLGSSRRTGDILLVSLHWGGNWGYDVLPLHREIAHALIDRAGADIVFGHSSHHPKGAEAYHGKLVIYGAGDLINDYEGIGGHEDYRADLSLGWFADIDAATGHLATLEMVPFQIRQFRLVRPSPADREWLREVMDRECSRFGGSVALTDRGSLRFEPGRAGGAKV